jgi:hypothetical protein
MSTDGVGGYVGARSSLTSAASEVNSLCREVVVFPNPAEVRSTSWPSPQRQPRAYHQRRSTLPPSTSRIMDWPVANSCWLTPVAPCEKCSDRIRKRIFNKRLDHPTTLIQHDKRHGPENSENCSLDNGEQYIGRAEPPSLQCYRIITGSCAWSRMDLEILPSA